MEEQKKCQCQSTAHGHRPGRCSHPAVDDGLCKECNEENRAPKRIRMERDTDNDAQLELWSA